MTEHQLQSECVKWFRKEHPDKIIFAIPNGEQRTHATGRYLKEEGVLAGVPDLLIAYKTKHFSGLFIEMKTGINVVSKKQLRLLNKLFEAGYMTSVIYTKEQFQVLIAEYLAE